MLKDTESPESPRWTDAELLAYANLAVDDLSVNVALARLATLSTATATAVFALPQDLVRVDFVTWEEVGVTTFLKEVKPHPGDAWDSSDESIENGWLPHWPVEGQLTLVQTPTSAVTLRVLYSAYREHMTDAASVLPIGAQQWMEEALAFYTCYLAHMREAVGRASLEQWSSKPENIVGNPLLVEALAWLQGYERLLRNAKPLTSLRTYS
jgi:hypothetical protein